MLGIMAGLDQKCFFKFVEFPFVPQRQILMVQSILQTTEFPQLLYVSGGRCHCCAGRACQAALVSTTAVCASRLVMLVTLRLGCVPPRCRRSRSASWPVWTRRTVMQRHSCMFMAGSAWDDALRAVFFPVSRPLMRCIMAGMDQDDSCSGMYKAGIFVTMYLALCSFVVFRR